MSSTTLKYFISIIIFNYSVVGLLAFPLTVKKMSHRKVKWLAHMSSNSGIWNYALFFQFEVGCLFIYAEFQFF